jgi:hypothetical protein
MRAEYAREDVRAQSARNAKHAATKRAMSLRY